MDNRNQMDQQYGKGCNRGVEYPHDDCENNQGYNGKRQSDKSVFEHFSNISGILS